MPVSKHLRHPRSRSVGVIATALISGPWIAATLSAAPDWNALRPMLEEKCYDCHGGIKTKGGVDMKKLDKDPSITSQYALWEKVRDVVANDDMPPEDEDPLKAKEKKDVLDWIAHSLEVASNANSGDPGPVTMRRLTNAEYDYSVRDLTGREFGLAKEFPADGGGGEGFSNTGDVLFVSPTQLDKYLAAARKIAEHASVMPGTGIVFHPQRVGLRGPVQFKEQAQQALYVWYQHKAEPYLPKDDENLREADYMLACWKWKHHEKTGAASLAKLAAEMKLVPAFLENWWTLLNKPEPKSRFLDLTRIPWRELPGPDEANPKAVPQKVSAALSAIEAQRKSWYWKDDKGGGHVQRQQQDADGLRPYDITVSTNGAKVVHLCIGDDGDGNKGDVALISKLQFKAGRNTVNYTDYFRARLKNDREALAKLGAQPPPQPDPKAKKPALTAEQLRARIAEAEGLLAKFGKHPLNAPVEADVLAVAAPQVITLPVPEGAYQVRATCRLDLSNPDIDLASIQWKLTVGTPMDVTKIMPGVLTVWKLRTTASRTVMGDFSVMKVAFPDEYSRRLEEVARNYLRRSPSYGVYYFSDEQLSAILKDKEKKELQEMKIDWGYLAPLKLDPKRSKETDGLITGHLREFASKAWRRPLSPEENQKLDALYQAGIAKELDRESAAREVVVFTLVSPNFLFKAETLPLASNTPPAAAAPDHPLSAWEVASRLSYFLWSSIPDAQLRRAAADGSLLKPDVLAAQTKRMLADPKAEAMAKEFMGQWLAFDGFANHSGVDLAKFPQFTPELRRDMYRETVTFFTKLIREDRPIHDIIVGDYTFLNERLAKFYGVPGVTGDEFRQVSVAAQHRGGLIGMGSVLTKTSRPIRTSPVVRGNWLLQTVLGFVAPPPPPNVPKLKENGMKPAGLREQLKLHREDKACSVCHDRIDPLGFALETFDPIGRYRPTDEDGVKIDDSAEMKDGTKFAGLDGLRAYLKGRDAQFTGHFCRKLLGYALGRQVLATDKALLAKMQDAVKAAGGRPSAAVMSIVSSRQFLNRKNEAVVAGN